MNQKIKSSMIVMLIFIMLMPSACASNNRDKQQAHRVLVGYFEELSEGNYRAAADLYGGSYEILVGYNPDIDPDDHAALWQRGCLTNGLKCLAIRTVTFNERTPSGEYLFTVEFNNSDESLFILDACCGDNPVSPPKFQFEYRVVEDDDGNFRVLDLPVYVP